MHGTRSPRWNAKIRNKYRGCTAAWDLKIQMMLHSFHHSNRRNTLFLTLWSLALQSLTGCTSWVLGCAEPPKNVLFFYRYIHIQVLELELLLIWTSNMITVCKWENTLTSVYTCLVSNVATAKRYCTFVSCIVYGTRTQYFLTQKPCCAIIWGLAYSRDAIWIGLLTEDILTCDSKKRKHKNNKMNDGWISFSSFRPATPVFFLLWQFVEPQQYSNNYDWLFKQHLLDRGANKLLKPDLLYCWPMKLVQQTARWRKLEKSAANDAIEKRFCAKRQ